MASTSSTKANGRKNRECRKVRNRSREQASGATTPPTEVDAGSSFRTPFDQQNSIGLPPAIAARFMEFKNELIERRRRHLIAETENCLNEQDRVDDDNCQEAGRLLYAEVFCLCMLYCPPRDRLDKYDRVIHRRMDAADNTIEKLLFQDQAIAWCIVRHAKQRVALAIANGFFQRFGKWVTHEKWCRKNYFDARESLWDHRRYLKLKHAVESGASSKEGGQYADADP